tara:strand:+ start:4488 stop:6332 length:1845 start_codon:yes stop_codon:yes gene_type:complete
LFDRGIKNVLTQINASSKQSSRFKLWWIFAGVGFSFFLVNFFILFILIIQLNVFDIFIHFSPKSGVAGFNILAFGIDDTSHSKRSDSIIVIHLDKEKDHIGALSIPRDTRVTIPDIGRTRINHAFSHGGVDLLKESVSQFLGVPINYYLKIDLSGVETLVNALGGIEVTVEKDLNYIDYAGDLYIDIPKGKQTLKGKKMMEYLRFRHDEEGDIGRIRRQQIFLDQLVKKVLSFDGVLQLPEIIKTAKSIISTDLSFVQMLSLIRDFKQAVNQNSVSKATVPGSASLVGGAYYWKPNVTALDKVVEDTLYGFSKVVKPKRVSVAKKELASVNDTVLVADSSPSVKNNALSTTELKKVAVLEKTNVKEEIADSKDVEIVASESLDDLELTDYEQKLLYSEDLSKTFDDVVVVSDTSAKQDISNISDTIREAVSNSDDVNNLIVLEEPVVASTESSTASQDINVLSSQDVSQTMDDQSATMNRRSLFIKEVQRVASTGLLHDQPKFDGMKCEVLNGIGVPGIAKFAAKVFKSLGMVVPRFANAGHFDYAKTMIVDWRGSVDQSLELAHLLEIDPANIIVYDLPHKPLDFTVVLGKDWLDKKSLLEYIYETFKTPDSF